MISDPLMSPMTTLQPNSLEPLEALDSTSTTSNLQSKRYKYIYIICMYVYLHIYIYTPIILYIVNTYPPADLENERRSRPGPGQAPTQHGS